MKILAIQAIGSYVEPRPLQRNNFQNIDQGFGKIVGGLSSGYQDQITSSRNGLQQGLPVFQSDLNNLSLTNNVNQNQDPIQKDFQNLLTAVQSAVKAIKTGDRDQITNSQNGVQQALNQFQTTLAKAQTTTGIPSPNITENDFQNFAGAIDSLLAAHKSGNQDQILVAKEAMRKAITKIQTDLPGFQKVQREHRHQQGKPANNSTNNNNFLSLLAAVKGYGSSGQTPPTANFGGLTLMA